MRVLTAKWGSADRISPAVVTGESAESTPAVSDKPIFIYVVDEADEDATTKIEKLILEAEAFVQGDRTQWDLFTDVGDEDQVGAQVN